MRETRMLVLIAVLAAAAFILMATVQVPVLPAAPYLRYDPSDVVGLLMAFAAGPLPGVAVVLLKDVLYLLFRARSIFGPLGNLIAVATFVGVAGWVYHRRPNPSVIIPFNALASAINTVLTAVLVAALGRRGLSLAYLRGLGR